jgi:hypothetical protein
MEDEKAESEKVVEVSVVMRLVGVFWRFGF